jgi:hypothetical protein
LIRQPAEHDQVVVACYADGVEVSHQLDALVRERAVADEIARDEIAVDPLGSKRPKRCLKRGEIPVDVR